MADETTVLQKSDFHTVSFQGGRIKCPNLPITKVKLRSWADPNSRLNVWRDAIHFQASPLGEVVRKHMSFIDHLVSHEKKLVKPAMENLSNIKPTDFKYFGAEWPLEKGEKQELKTIRRYYPNFNVPDTVLLLLYFDILYLFGNGQSKKMVPPLMEFPHSVIGMVVVDSMPKFSKSYLCDFWDLGLFVAACLQAGDPYETALAKGRAWAGFCSALEKHFNKFKKEFPLPHEM